MKSLTTYITEASNHKVDVEYNFNPDWSQHITPGVDYSGHVVLIIGEPVNKEEKDGWKRNISIAKKVWGNSVEVSESLDSVIKEIEDETGEPLEIQDTVCLSYIVENGEFATYIYGDAGVDAIK